MPHTVFGCLWKTEPTLYGHLLQPVHVIPGSGSGFRGRRYHNHGSYDCCSGSYGRLGTEGGIPFGSDTDAGGCHRTRRTGVVVNDEHGGGDGWYYLRPTISTNYGWSEIHCNPKESSIQDPNRVRVATYPSLCSTTTRRIALL